MGEHMVGGILMGMVGFFGFTILLLFIYLTSALPLTILIWFVGRRKAEWLKKEFLFVFIPWVVWLLLMYLVSTGKKSLSNIIEAFYCGIPGGLILLPRALLSASSKKMKLLIILISTAIAIVIVFFIFFLTPALPE